MTKVHRLDEVSDVIDSLHQTPEYSFDGFPMVRVTDIKGGYINLSNTLRVNKQVFDEFTKKYCPKKGDILMTRVGSYGTCCVVKTEEKFCLGQNTVVISPKIDSDYLYYTLSSDWIKQQIQSIVTGSTQKTISLKNIREFQIPLIDYPEKVAKVLSDLDAKIELNNKINAELEAMAKLIYDYWFVQFDFPLSAELAASMGKPELEGKPYKASGGKMVFNKELKREIPEGWEVKELKIIESNIVTGKTPSTKDLSNFDGDIPFICIGDVRGNMHVVDTEITLSNNGANSQAKKFIPKGSICVTCIASPGLVAFATKDSQTNQQLNSIICENFENRYYLYFYLKDYFNFAKAKTGNTFANMNKGDFSAIKVIKAENKVLELFSISLKSSIEKILINSRENQKLSELRDWLLPMLMNGQVKVGDAKEYAGDGEVGMAAEGESGYKRS